MNQNIKRSLIIIAFLSLIIPFIFQNTFYPLFHFGMFAQSTQVERPLESFVVQITRNQDAPYIFNPEQMGLGAGHFSYIARSYYYQNKSEQLLRQIARNLEKKESFLSLSLIQVRSHLHQAQLDSIHVYKWSPNEP